MTPPTPNPSPSRGPWSYPEAFADPSSWVLLALADMRQTLWRDLAAAALAEADLTLTVTWFDPALPNIGSRTESAIALRS